MPADLPYDRDTDRKHAQALRDATALKRRVESARADLCKAAGIKRGEKRPPGSPPATERASVPLSVTEEARIKRAAQAVGLSVKDFLRAAGLHFFNRVEGQ